MAENPLVAQSCFLTASGNHIHSCLIVHVSYFNNGLNTSDTNIEDIIHADPLLHKSATLFSKKTNFISKYCLLLI